MTIFLPIGLGMIGFGIMAAAGWAGYRKRRFLKPVLWVLMIPVSTAGLVLGWTNSSYFSVPSALTVTAWALFPLFVLLFLYSLYIEIPLRLAYIDKEQPSRVVTDGTYSLCRHPAFLWYTGWMGSLLIISGAVTLVIALPVWMLANIGALFMDEKFCLQADFADEYRKYQQSTPMLIPNRVSIARFRTDVKNRVMRKKSAPEYRGGIK